MEVFQFFFDHRSRLVQKRLFLILNGLELVLLFFQQTCLSFPNKNVVNKNVDNVIKHLLKYLECNILAVCLIGKRLAIFRFFTGAFRSMPQQLIVLKAIYKAMDYQR